MITVSKNKRKQQWWTNTLQEAVAIQASPIQQWIMDIQAWEWEREGMEEEVVEKMVEDGVKEEDPGTEAAHC